MNPEIIRIVVVLLFALLLAFQTAAARGLPNRQRAFGFAGLAMLVFAAYNLILVLKIGSPTVLQALFGLSIVLLAAAIISYIVSARRGEMRKQYDKYTDKMQDYVKRRAERDKKL